MPMGLNKDTIIAQLGKMGLNSGSSISADLLKAAIADLMVENNNKIESDIRKLLLDHNDTQHK